MTAAVALLQALAIVGEVVALVIIGHSEYGRKQQERDRRRVQDALFGAHDPLSAGRLGEASGVPARRLMPILYRLVHDSDVDIVWLPRADGIRWRAYQWRYDR